MVYDEKLIKLAQRIKNNIDRQKKLDIEVEQLQLQQKELDDELKRTSLQQIKLSKERECIRLATTEIPMNLDPATLSMITAPGSTSTLGSQEDQNNISDVEKTFFDDDDTNKS